MNEGHEVPLGEVGELLSGPEILDHAHCSQCGHALRWEDARQLFTLTPVQQNGRVGFVMKPTAGCPSCFDAISKAERDAAIASKLIVPALQSVRRN